MTIVRKTQQKEVYAAEAEVPVGRTFPSIEAVQEVLDGLREEPWWPEQIARVEVSPGPAGSMSLAAWEPAMNAGRMQLNVRDHLNELVMCHELAHVIARAEGAPSGHDPWWARRYAEVVYRVMGSDTWLALTTSFKKHGVNYG